MSNRINGDTYVAGSLSAESMNVPSGSIGDAECKTGDPIDNDKLQHLHLVPTDGGIPRAGTFAAKHAAVFVASGAGTVRSFRCTQVGANTTGTSGFDVLVNGTSILSGHVTFTSADAAGAVKSGTISAPTLAADDIVSVEFTVDSGTPDGTGPIAMVAIEENAN